MLFEEVSKIYDSANYSCDNHVICVLSIRGDISFVSERERGYYSVNKCHITIGLTGTDDVA